MPQIIAYEPHSTIILFVTQKLNYFNGAVNEFMSSYGENLQTNALKFAK